MHVVPMMLELAFLAGIPVSTRYDMSMCMKYEADTATDGTCWILDGAIVVAK